MKPQLACDVDLDKVRYPIMVFPKIDGVRALNVDNRLVGRSGKQFKNKLNSEFFTDSRFNGFDGEMVVDRITGYGICNETTSALGTIKGQIPTRWCLFDYVVEGWNDHLPYQERYHQLENCLARIYRDYPELGDRLWRIPYRLAYSRNDVEEIELEHLSAGYEGLILRDPEAPYKFGRSTAREGYYLRLKRFLDAEISVTDVIEGKSNQNELRANPHGYAERSTHAEHMVPNGMVGTIVGHLLETITFNGRIIAEKGTLVEVAPGRMQHDDRRYYMDRPERIRGKIVKFQFFPIGIKDKLRFPTFQGFRDPVDM